MFRRLWIVGGSEVILGEFRRKVWIDVEKSPYHYLSQTETIPPDVHGTGDWLPVLAARWRSTWPNWREPRPTGRGGCGSCRLLVVIDSLLRSHTAYRTTPNSELSLPV
jgi:hypothetical protein